MDNYTSYEIRAEAFRLMTGHMAPGKDAAPESYPEPFEVRSAAWEEWSKQHDEVIRSVLVAVEHVMGDPDQ